VRTSTYVTKEKILYWGGSCNVPASSVERGNLLARIALQKWLLHSNVIGVQ
jgi:hypothetical protein